MTDANKHEIHFKDFSDVKKHHCTKFTMIAYGNHAHALKQLQMDLISGRQSGRIYIVFEPAEWLP